MTTGTRDEQRISRSLLVAPTWVGDTVLALPVVEALAGSGRRVDVLAAPHLHPLLRLSPSVDGLIAKSVSRAETIRRLERVGYGETILLPNSFSSAWLVYRAGIPRRIGYRGDGRAPFLSHALRRPVPPEHQLRDYDRLLRSIDVEPSTSFPSLTIPAELAASARSALSRAGIPMAEDRRPVVGIFAGAEFGSSKRWPAERFAETARRLAGSSWEVRPVFIAGPRETDLLEDLRRRTNDLPGLGPDLDLADLAAVLAQLDLLITNDSGPMHLAAAVGTRCIALFGPTDPARTSPCGRGHRVFYTSRWCSPCFRRRCPLFHQRCMRKICVDEVLDAVAVSLPSSTARESISDQPSTPSS
jgi:heptosyltransferase-2